MAYKATRSVDIKKSGGKSPEGRHSHDKPWALPPEGLEEPAVKSLSKLSHDIRTQLYIIIGFAELMLEEVPGKINDEQRRSLNDVLTSGKRLQDLMNDIVERSKGVRKS